MDLYDLEGAERDEALDAIVEGAAAPFVLTGGHLVCVGGLDYRAIDEALSALRADAVQAGEVGAKRV